MKKEECKQIMKHLNDAAFQYVFKSQYTEEVIEEEMLVVSLEDAFKILSEFEEEVSNETVAKLQVEITTNDVGKVLKELLEMKHKEKKLPEKFRQLVNENYEEEKIKIETGYTN